MDYNNTELQKSQDVKLDNEIKEKFTPKREASELLAQSYERIGYENKAERVSDCGTWLEFQTSGTGDGWRLHNVVGVGLIRYSPRFRRLWTKLEMITLLSS